MTLSLFFCIELNKYSCITFNLQVLLIGNPDFLINENLTIELLHRYSQSSNSAV